MKTLSRTGDAGRVARAVAYGVAGLLLALTQTGCLVAGYSSRGGGFIWPGGLGLVVLVLLAIFLLRGRR